MIILLLGVFIFFNFFYLLALLKKDYGIIDTAWALSFFLIFLFGSYTVSYNLSYRSYIIGALVFIWSLRLSGYIFYRSHKVGHEDYRYANWRKEWGIHANRNAYFKVFLLQACLSLIIASPLYLIHVYPQNNISFGTVFDYLGLFLWLIGFLFEAVGDYQKHKFKQKPENKESVLKTGLWKYTRHPNYFGEALLWWGIFFMIINQVPFYYAMVGPMILHIFLLKVSGVAMLEKKYESNTEYDEYKKSTNAFIPWLK